MLMVKAIGTILKVCVYVLDWIGATLKQISIMSCIKYVNRACRPFIT